VWPNHDTLYAYMEMSQLNPCATITH
jgi:hypothetical protein